jgi:indole-3-glycerol phosphate synthase
MAFVPAALRPPLPRRAFQSRPVCARPRRAGVVASAGTDVPDVLKKILARKADEVAALKAELAAAGPEHPVAATLARKGVERRRAFETALKLPKGTLTVIAEIKRRSPSKGFIGEIKDPASLSRTYYEGGAAAISVLTDEEGFGGTMEDLKKVVAQQKKFEGNFPGPCPVLRKDFIVDEVQIAEAAVGGASAVLLIMAALGRERCGELQQAAWDMGLDALVEVHDEAEVEDAIAIGATVVGVNNRNLKTFEVDLQTSVRMADKIPDGVMKVAESGVDDCNDAWMLRDAGYCAVLVGESLVKAYEGNMADGTGYTVGYNQAKGLIKAFKAKGSTSFGRMSSAAFWGKGEGAKETLVRCRCICLE